MATRTQRKTVVFSHPFRLKGVDRVLPPGDYEVLTDEELIEGSWKSLLRWTILTPSTSHGRLVCAINGDQHCGTAAQKATDLRRLPANVKADQNALRLRQDELEAVCSRHRQQIGAKPPRRLAIFSISLPLR